jgi:nicotinic acid phosphoribosyltransferase
MRQEATSPIVHFILFEKRAKGIFAHREKIATAQKILRKADALRISRFFFAMRRKRLLSKLHLFIQLNE